MRILFIGIGAVLGGGFFGLEGALLGAVSAELLAEIHALRKRVALLEQQANAAAEGSDEVVFGVVDDTPETTAVRHQSPDVAPRQTVVQPRTTAVQPDEERYAAAAPPSGPDRFFGSLGSIGQQAAELLSRFLTGGNLVLKTGVVILFFGISFLVKYAAQHNVFPLELRLAGAALGGVVLLVLGWRLRSRAGYGLVLQGGGVGILYLVVYGAAKLYSLVPMPLSFALMVGLVVLSGLLAVLQNARMLAVFGVAGGFLAPVLMSTGSGDHVLLFSYFALLNVGILGIAWYKSWRELNLLGFFFTFGIGTLWGSQGYQPAHFSTTEPFLILYFVFYVTISVLFAHRQPLQLRGFIDGPLVFGLPLVVTGLQYALVKEYQYGMAISSCTLGFFYLLLATLLWRRLAEGMRMLCEAFLALGVMFATMTIPLALDPSWTSSVWALEGGAMVWVGVRQQRLLARLFGVLLQLGAAWFFVHGTLYPFGVIAFLNSGFFGCLFLAAAGLFSSFMLMCHADILRSYEKHLHLPLLLWGLIWWYFGGLRECDRHFQHIRAHNALLLFGSASTILLTIIAARSSWRQLAIAQAAHLGILILALLGGLWSMPSTSHLFTGWGAPAWAIAIYCQYRLLHTFDTLWPEKLMGCWHAATLWLILLLGCLEWSWLTDTFLGLGEVWTVIGWGILPATALLLLIGFGRRLSWPISRWRNYYFGIGITLPALLLAVWSVFCLGVAGDPAPLPFVPLINPLELSLVFVVLVILKWAVACSRGDAQLLPGFPARTLFWLVAGLIFLWANGAVARGVHFLANIPYDAEFLYHSVVFQACIAALWSFGALSTTIWATRAGNRLVWCCGAVLLGLVVVKLFVVDLAGTGTVARIVSFLVVGVLMLVIGYFSPMPPGKKEESV